MTLPVLAGARRHVKGIADEASAGEAREDDAMDLVFWAGIGIGGVVSLLASIAANLYADQIRAWWEKRQQVRGLRRLEVERTTYRNLVKLRADPAYRDAFFAAALARVAASSAAVVLLAIGALASDIEYLARGVPPLQEVLSTDMTQWHQGTIVRLLVLSLVSGLMFFSTWLLLDTQRKMSGDVRRLRDFDNYQSSLRQRWPDEDWS